jgi:hypothetical protein
MPPKALIYYYAVAYIAIFTIAYLLR